MPGYFVNEISNCVDESLIGYVRAHNHLELVGRAVITRAQIPSVAVISGNGSGHEPAMVKTSDIYLFIFVCFNLFDRLGWLCWTWNAECL